MALFCNVQPCSYIATMSLQLRCSCREVALLSHLRHENVIALRDIVPPACPSSFKDVYLVYELMDTDLHQIIRSPQQLSPDHISYFIYQVSHAILYIRP